MVNVINKKSNSGFSLIEVILAAVLFALSVAGFYASLEAVRRPVENNDRAIGAARYGQEVLERLRSRLDSDTWLTNTTDGLGLGSYTVGNGTYTAQYVIDCETMPCASDATPRRITLTVSY